MTNYEFYKKEIDEAISNGKLESFLENTFDFYSYRYDAYSMMDLFGVLMEEHVCGLDVKFVPYEVSFCNGLTVGKIYTVKDGYFVNDFNNGRFPLGSKLKSVEELKEYLNGNYDHSINNVVILKE